MGLPRLAKAADALFGRTFELSLTKGYVAGWQAVNAIRELIQNALDSDSPFHYEFTQEEGGLTLKLFSEFSSLTPQTLLLGATSKAALDDKIGNFGEGYKIALLVLTREGYDVEILNGDFIWRPRFKYSRTFGEEVLVVDELAADKPNPGLTFVVKGIDDELYAQIVDSCLRMQDNVGAVKTTQFGHILMERPGMLYVGSLFVCETDLKYGYDILPEHIQLERDRQTVDSWKLKDLTLSMWYATEETDHIVDMIFKEVPDVEYARYNSPQLLKEECYRVFKENNPDTLLASTPEELKKMVKAGMTKTVYIGGAAHAVISGSQGYRDAAKGLRIQQAPISEVLAEFLARNRSEMRTKAIVDFKKLIVQSHDWVRK